MTPLFRLNEGPFRNKKRVLFLAWNGSNVSTPPPFLLHPFRRRPSRPLTPIWTRGHGRIESRTAAVCHDSDWLGAHDGPALAAMGSVTAQHERRGRKQRRETRSFPGNKRLTPEHLLRHVRSHWALENTLHGVLDVTMNDDD